MPRAIGAYRGTPRGYGYQQFTRVLVKKGAQAAARYARNKWGSTRKHLMNRITKKARSGWTGTKATPVRHPLYNKARILHGHTSVSYYRGKKRRLSKAQFTVLRNVGKRLFYTQGTLGVVGVLGAQKVSVIGLLKGNELYKLATAYSGGVATNAQKTQITWIRYFKAKIEFTNTSNTTTRYSIYDVTPRNDMDVTATGDPSDDWDEGLADESGGVSGRAGRWHSSPFKSTKFTKKWLVRKVTNISLEPGSSHIHYYKAIINKKIDLYRLDELGQTDAARPTPAQLKGWTHNVMIVGNGVPQLTEIGQSVTTNAPCFALGYTTETCVQAVTDNSTTITMDTQQFTTGVQADLEVINPISGEKETGVDIGED